MTFTIKEPGFYKDRSGRKAEVFCERDGVWYGRSDMDSEWVPRLWLVNGDLERCSARAIRESGAYERAFSDMVVYGTGIITADERRQIAERTKQLMDGLKPCE